LRVGYEDYPLSISLNLIGYFHHTHRTTMLDAALCGRYYISLLLYTDDPTHPVWRKKLAAAFFG
jgi:hypothetical protein